jgi:curved DNA-binding protein CbpA
LIDENVAPTPKPGVDFSSLSPSPTPEQYFLLSRLDGSLTVAELCKISGIGRKKTLEALETLAMAGAIDLPGFETPAADGGGADKTTGPAKPASSAESTGPAKQAKAFKSSKTVTPNYPTSIEEFDFDQRLLQIDAPLGDQHRRELLCLHDQLEQMSFYDIFGVEKDASKGPIKKAYFRMSKRYHPDKFFRKEMGDIGPMLETVFKEITKAYRTLSSKRKRKEYDAGLAAQTSQPRRANPGAAAATSSQGEALGGSDSSPAEQNKRKAAAVLLMRRAEKLQLQGEFELAGAEYQKALALNRDADLAVRVARMMLDDAGLPQEASSFARASLKLGADEAISRFELGRANEQLGATQSAIKEYRKVLLTSPEHAGAKARLTELGAPS